MWIIVTASIVAPPDTLTANYMRVGTIGLAECIQKVVDRSNWKDKFRKLPLGRGVGLACSSYLSGAGLPINWNDLPHSGVQLKLDRSGGVTVNGATRWLGAGFLQFQPAELAMLARARTGY